jgi:hypothetical protein
LQTSTLVVLTSLPPFMKLIILIKHVVGDLVVAKLS